MGARCRYTSLLLLALSLAGCRPAKVETYRIPKEKDPELPGMASADQTPAAAAPTDGNTMASTAVPTSEGPALTWTAPSDWKLQPAKAMRKATYLTPGPKGTSAELSITAFPGDVGGELANLNRWRGQISLPPLAQAQVENAVSRSRQGDLDVTVADFPNPAADGKEILGAIVPFQNGTWFFKLMGPKAAVQSQKDAFLAFVKTIKEATP
jgi:hypothetical protein